MKILSCIPASNYGGKLVKVNNLNDIDNHEFE